MARNARPKPDVGYFEDARRPLHGLIFLLPLISAYEIGLVFVDHAGPLQNNNQVVARHLMQLFFSLFGATGILLPGFLIIAILLATHVISGQPWKVRTSTLLGMVGESFICTIPLFILNNSIRHAATLSQDVTRQDWLEDVVISTGAGVYEELVFRLVLVTSLVILLEDMIRMRKNYARALAVLVAAILFAAHHHPPFGSEPYRFGFFLFRVLAGVYLGFLFLVRGYGIAASCHALYNVLVETMEAIPP